MLVTNLTFGGHAYNRYGDVSKMSIGVGGNYDNKFYLGAGLNFHDANLEQYDSARFTSSSNNVTETFNKQYTPFSESSSGFSASVGVIGKINPQDIPDDFLSIAAANTLYTLQSYRSVRRPA